MLTVELPVFVIVMVWDAELPVFTFPKLKLVGLTDSVFVAATPVPLKAIEVGDVGALLVMEMLPDTAPATVGTKATVIVVCWPAFTLRGSEYPLSTKEAEPVCDTCVMLKVAVPVLVTTKAWDVLLPTTVLPKLIEVELTWIAGSGTALTVSVAAALVTVPALLLTTTRYVDPLSDVAVAGVV